MPSEKALEIAARIWCDQEMTSAVMDVQAATRIAIILDEIIGNSSEKEG